MEIKELEEKLKNTLNVLKEDLNGIQVGQVSEKMLKNVSVTYEDGRKQLLLEISTIRTQGFNNLLIKPFIEKDLVLIEKTIASSGLGVNTGKQGHEILVTFPPITKERREQLAKSVIEYANKAKQSSRDIRHNYLKENKPKTKEEKIKIEKNISQYMDNFNRDVEKIVKDKQNHLRNE